MSSHTKCDSEGSAPIQRRLAEKGRRDIDCRWPAELASRRGTSSSNANNDSSRQIAANSTARPGDALEASSVGARLAPNSPASILPGPRSIATTQVGRLFDRRQRESTRTDRAERMQGVGTIISASRRRRRSSRRSQQQDGREPPTRNADQKRTA